MKKRILLLFLSVYLSTQIFSNPIERKKAETLAINFYSFYAPKEISDFSVKETIINRYNGKNSFYTVVFNAGGFVIIAADDNAKPVLGYSFTGTVEKNVKNPSVLMKFESYNRQIEYLKKLKAKNEDIKQLWDNLENKKLKNDFKAVSPLLTTLWAQSPFYNQFCPPNTPTGCVATALAQIMNYYQWPIAGKSWHIYTPTTHPEYGSQYVDFSSTTYDWTNMPNNLSLSSTDDEKNAVATLIYHCGVSVNMDYDPLGSGAYSKDVLYSLSNYFLYDFTTLKLLSFDVNNETEWINIIKNEIDNNRPVYYAGSSEEDGGHAWVCDGYDDNDYLHINWGWGGTYNGYFLPSAMSPGSYEFTEFNRIIIGITPGNPAQELMWTKQASGFENESRGIQYISVIDERTAWAIAFDGSGNGASIKEFTLTSNGGATWNSREIDIANSYNYGASMICAIDDKTAWVPLHGPSGGGMIAKTTNGGENWEQQSSAEFSAPNGFPNIIHFWDENNGFCQGDPNGGFFEIYTTVNGGTTWSRVAESNIPANLNEEYGTVGYYDVCGDTIWFATNKGRIYRSPDKGYNWTVFNTPISNSSFEISFKDADTGIIQIRQTGDNSAYITTNGGEDWNVLNFTGNFYTRSFKFVRGSNLLITTGSDYETPAMGVSYSTDNGSTFTDYAEYYQNFQFLTLGVAGENAIWAGGFNSSAYNEGMWHYGTKPYSTGFSADNEELCITDEVTVTDETVGSPDSWLWNFGEGADPQTSTEKGPHIVNYSSEGTKTISLTTSKDGENYSTSKLVHISGDIPSSPGEINGDTEVDAGETQTYSVQDNEVLIFHWILPNTRWSGSSETNSIDITFSDYAKSDTLKVLSENGCGLSSTSKLYIKISGSLGINNITNNDDTDIIVYPNPAIDILTIENAAKNTEFYIYNASGKLVMHNQINSNTEEIDISNLAFGSYYITFVNNNNYKTKLFNKI